MKKELVARAVAAANLHAKNKAGGLADGKIRSILPDRKGARTCRVALDAVGPARTARRRATFFRHSARGTVDVSLATGAATERVGKRSLLQATEKKIGRGHEYALTEAGKAAQSVIAALGDWGARYAQPNIGPEDCDPYMMFRAVRRHGNLAALPARRFVIRFELRDLPKSRSSLTTWWLVWDRGELDACLTNPGFEIDLVVNVKVDILVRVWMGNI